MRDTGIGGDFLKADSVGPLVEETALCGFQDSVASLRSASTRSRYGPASAGASPKAAFGPASARLWRYRPDPSCSERNSPRLRPPLIRRDAAGRSEESIGTRDGPRGSPRFSR